MNGHGAEIKIHTERELITIPREPGVYFSICKRWLHYPEFNRSRLSCGCIKVRLIRQRIGRKTEERTPNYVMYPLCCSCPSILAISYLSLVLLTPPSLPPLLSQPAHPPSPSLRGPQGAELFRPSPTFSDGD